MGGLRGPRRGRLASPAARAPRPGEPATLPGRRLGEPSDASVFRLGTRAAPAVERAAAPGALPSVAPAGGHRTGRAGGRRRGPTATVIVYEAQAGPGAGGSRAEEGQGARSRGGQRCPPRLQAASPDTRGRYHPGDPEGQGRRESFAGDSTSPERSPAFPGPPQTHATSPSGAPREGGSGGPAPLAAPASAHSPVCGRASGRLSLRTDLAGPAPVRSLLPAPPSPRPREVGLAAAPKSRSGLPQLSRALLPPSSASRWQGCGRPALTSHAPQPEVAFCRQRWPPAPPVCSG